MEEWPVIRPGDRRLLYPSRLTRSNLLGSLVWISVKPQIQGGPPPILHLRESRVHGACSMRPLATDSWAVPLDYCFFIIAALNPAKPVRKNIIVAGSGTLSTLTSCTLSKRLPEPFTPDSKKVSGFDIPVATVTPRNE